MVSIIITIDVVVAIDAKYFTIIITESIITIVIIRVVIAIIKIVVVVSVSIIVVNWAKFGTIMFKEDMIIIEMEIAVSDVKYYFVRIHTNSREDNTITIVEGN